MSISKNWPARAVVVVLLTQALAYYAVASRRETIPNVPPLSALPQTISGWQTAAEFPIEKEVQDVLRADDTLSRVYVNDEKTQSASLFLAFFKTQRYGQAPHSPKNCMPGAGWEPVQDRKLSIPIAGAAAPIVVNDYVIQRGDEQSVVLYWYQSHNRAIAAEIAAKFWLVVDAIHYRRSDTALVRIIVPVRQGQVDSAQRTAVSFVQKVYPEILRDLPL